MSKVIVNALKNPIDYSFDLLNQFIDVCPDDLWAEKAGGWPIWQQVYHTISSIDFFIAYEGPKESPLASDDVAGLMVVGEKALSKEALKAASVVAQKRLEGYIDSLTDECLPQRSEKVFANSQWDITHGGILSFVAGHILYHIGSCDAALRNRGLKGVF